MTIADKIKRAKNDYDEVYDAGKKAEYDSFWDAYQNFGARTSYVSAFGGEGWYSEILKPKYPIETTSAERMFTNCALSSKNSAFDITSIMDIDFSKCVNFYYAFAFAKISHIGVVDIRACTTSSYFAYCFGSSHIQTIDKVICDEIQTLYGSMFQNATALKNITFEGVIGSTINLQWSPLTKESITSVINALSSTASGQTCTFKKSAKEAAFTATEWSALIGTKSNWTISLV